nr:ClpC2 [Babesia sp. Xinjiang]
MFKSTYNINYYMYIFDILYSFINKTYKKYNCIKYTNIYIHSEINKYIRIFKKEFITEDNITDISNHNVIYTFYNIINKFIFGQNLVTKKITTYLLNFNTYSNKKPIGSFLLCGPSGTGKTEIVKLITNYLYKSQNNLIQVDMSEYKESHSVSKLIGSPPGYVGHEDGGNLIRKINLINNPVILFDEIEKASKDIFSIFLQILDEGILTDSKGNSCKFNKSLIFFTSNLGSRIFDNTDVNELFNIKYFNKVRADIMNNFKLEFINRLNDIIIFNPLSPIYIYNILDKYIYSNNYTNKITMSTQIKSLLSYISYSSSRGSRFFMNNINQIVNNLNTLKTIKLNKNKNNFVKYIVLKWYFYTNILQNNIYIIYI